MRHRRNTSAAVITALLVAAAGGAAAANGARPRLSIVVRRAVPAVVRIGEPVTVTGTVRGAPRGASAQLQTLRGTSWQLQARGPLARHGGFTLHWRVAAGTQTGPASWRVSVIHAGRRIGATRPQQLGIGPAYVACAPPVAPAVNIPVGDGWIVGGLYYQGGAFPGIDACSARAYTITARTSSGSLVASQDVAAGHSYTLAPLPAGTYTLQTAQNFCRGSATVAAGRQTVADTYCDLP
jgi:hypothetical protein